MTYRITDAENVAFEVVDKEDAYKRFWDMVTRSRQLGTFTLRDSTGRLLAMVLTFGDE